MKKIQIACWCGLVSAAVFSLLNISFHADISLSAFPLAVIFTALLAYFSLVGMFRKNDEKALPPFRKLVQYEPYAYLAIFILRRSGNTGTSYVLDFVTVIFWLFLTASSFMLQYYLSDKRVYSYNSAWQKAHKARAKVKRSFSARVIFEAVDWIDAIFQAVFMVLLIQIFFFQLYQIPSESMVPTFLIKDRVVVGKTTSGPKFPLSDVGLPYLKTYKRGNIVVFRNPHYIIDRKSEIKTFVSQLVYMLSFTTINLNVDANGIPKADPLVKRVAGVAGEQLVMQDGVLYARTKDSDEFKAVEYDATKAAWNLNDLPANIKSHVEVIPFDSATNDSMLECEKLRRELNLSDVASECASIAKDFSLLALRTAGSKSNDETSVGSLFSDTDLLGSTLFTQNLAVSQKLLTVAGGSAWFNKFMTDWTSKINLSSTSYIGGDIYSDANFRLNIMIKRTVGRIILRNAQLMLSDISIEAKNNDEKRLSYFKDANMLYAYIELLDQRNMPVFPANDKNGNAQYIPNNCFFMMGDNRFNSLDMRHSYDRSLKAISPLDDYSVTYYSNMAPQYVNRRYILGTTSFRFWPVNRMGKL